MASIPGSSKQHFKALLKSFKNDLSSERPKPSNIISHNSNKKEQVVNVQQETNKVDQPKLNPQNSKTSIPNKTVLQKQSQININPIQKTYESQPTLGNSSSRGKFHNLKTLNIRNSSKGSLKSEKEKSSIRQLQKPLEQKLKKYMHKDKIQNVSQSNSPYKESDQKPSHKFDHPNPQNPVAPQMFNVQQVQNSRPQVKKVNEQNVLDEFKQVISQLDRVIEQDNNNQHKINLRLEPKEIMRSPSFSNQNDNEFSFDKGSNMRSSNSKSSQSLKRSVRFLLEDGSSMIDSQSEQKKSSKTPQKKDKSSQSKKKQSKKIKERKQSPLNELSNQEEPVNIQTIGERPQRNSEFDLRQDLTGKLISHANTIIMQYSSQKNLREKQEKNYCKQTEASLIRRRQTSKNGDLIQDTINTSIYDQNRVSIFDPLSRQQQQLIHSNSTSDEFTFKPKLNEISNLLAIKKRQAQKDQYKKLHHSQPRNHHEILYRFDQEKKKQKQKQIEEQAMLKKLEEQKQCTFKPQLYTERGPRQNQFAKPQGDFYERNQSWQEQIETKLKSERKKEKKEQVSECTFKPDLKQSLSSYGFVQRSSITHQVTDEIRGIDVFLKRLQDAQQRKIEEAEVFLLPSQKKTKNKQKKGDGQLWRNIDDFSEDQSTVIDNKERQKATTIQKKLQNINQFQDAMGMLKDELRSINFNKTNQTIDYTQNYEGNRE